MCKLHKLIVITVLLSCGSSLLAQSALPTPRDLWADFDPNHGDLNEQVIRQETKAGIFYRESYISAYVFGEEIRVFCKYAVKADVTNAPGLLNVHGWMSSPSIDNEYVNDGWAVMSHDYCGKTGQREHFTKYPDKLRYGNMDTKFGYRVKSKLPDGSFITDPRQTDDYLWYIIQRRVLSYLLAQKEVDRDRIGAKGYSYGGTIMWNLATDRRVKAVVAYFGIGWLEYYRSRSVWMYNKPSSETKPTPGEKLYLAAVAPQSHALQITAATLWLNGTNDHHGGHERGEQTFKMLPANVPWSFAHQPRGHHDTTDIGQNTKLWLQKHVLGKKIHWPQQADSRISLDSGGVPELRVSPADPEQVRELKMYYALKNPVSFGRAWRDVEVKRDGDSWLGQMPVMNVEDYVFAFANIRYDNRVVRSSPFTAAIPARLGNAKATDKPSADLSGAGEAWTNAGPVQGKGGVKGFRILSNRGTLNQQFSDPKWKAPQGGQLSFRFYCTQPQKLVLSVNNHSRATVDFTASDDWQQKTLPANLFINRLNKQSLKDWSNTKRIDINPAKGADITKVVFADFKWAVPAIPPPNETADNKKPRQMLPDDRVYLTKELASHAESFLKVVNDKAWEGGPIRVGGTIYKRGLGVHADSKLVFPLGGKYETFSVVGGPDDSHHGQIEMKILVDEKQVWTSGPTRSHDGSKRRRLIHSVKDAKTLTLIVTQSDGNRDGDHASWGGAYLQRTATAKTSATNRWKVAGLPHARAKLEPFLQTYCIKCHGPSEQQGQVRFDELDYRITNNDNAQRWQDVLDQLNGGDMPPEEADQPTQDELANALDALTGAVSEARRRLTDHGGEIKMRRLNRREYSNTIRDLFGFDVLPDDIPEDGEIATFDTVGAEQFFTSSHFDKYLELGRKVASEGFKFNTQRRRVSSVSRTEPEQRVTKKMREKLDDLDRKMAMKKAGKSWMEMGFKDEGEMEVVFRQWDSRAEIRRQYLQYPLVDSGVYNSDVAKWVSVSKHIDIRGEYLIRIKGGVVGQHHDLRKIVRIWDRDQIRGTLPIAGTPENPETVQLRVRQPMNRYHLAVNIRENVPDNTINSMIGYVNRLEGPGDRTDPRAAIWIDWLEIEGPFYPDQRPRFEEILYPGVATGVRQSILGDDGQARDLIEQFAFEAFRRRTPEQLYIDQLHALFQKNRAAGLDYKSAMTEVMGIILASPGFLFIHEQVPVNTNAETTSARQLDNRELAVRLSYFLWSSPPDDELYAADLSDVGVYSQQVDRLLADPKVRGLRDGFISQWAELDRYDAITVNNRQHIQFNEGVRQDAKQEVREFFGTLIEENLPASNLIDSDFVTINSALAVHYGIDLPNPKNGKFQKAMLPNDSPRGGMLTQAAFLIAGSNGERSSPVIRGALVMEKLLHDKPSPPPPNVPELGAASTTPKTNRDMVKLHQAQAVCASCHKKMDTIGFGLENFDTIGIWRDTEKVGRNQVPIQPGGTLPDGTVFANVKELKKVLLLQDEQLAEELIESMLAYALGRTIEFSDADDVAKLVAKLKVNDFRVRSMVREIALSKLFQTR